MKLLLYRAPGPEDEANLNTTISSFAFSIRSEVSCALPLYLSFVPAYRSMQERSMAN